jgi:hypothetical protein
MASADQLPELVEPTETIQMPAPSWGPALLAFGLLGLLASTFATGFIFPTWSYAVVGAIFVLFALRSLIRKGKRSFYSLPPTTDPLPTLIPGPRPDRTTGCSPGGYRLRAD